MSKGENTKQFIVSTATGLFARRGYSAITMKDVCEACSLSRGGLYRYFNSTKEIFITMLESDVNEGRRIVEQAIADGVPALVIFDHFLQGEKAAIFSSNNGLYFAVHEFAFYEEDQRSYFDDRLKATIEIIGAILRHGQAKGECKAFDVEIMANHIIYFLDSLKTSSPVLTMTEEMIDKQLNLLKEMIR